MDIFAVLGSILFIQSLYPTNWHTADLLRVVSKRSRHRKHACRRDMSPAPVSSHPRTLRRRHACLRCHERFKTTRNRSAVCQLVGYKLWMKRIEPRTEKISTWDHRANLSCDDPRVHIPYMPALFGRHLCSLPCARCSSFKSRTRPIGTPRICCTRSRGAHAIASTGIGKLHPRHRFLHPCTH